MEFTARIGDSEGSGVCKSLFFARLATGLD
jgi:hypothetical protein